MTAINRLVSQKMEEKADFQYFFMEFERFYLTQRLDNLGIWVEEFWLGRKATSIFVHYFTNIVYLKDFCRERWPEHSKDFSFVENCALSHASVQEGYDETGIHYFDLAH